MISFLLLFTLIGIGIILFMCETSFYYTPLIGVTIWILFILFNTIINQDFRIVDNGAMFIGFSICILSLGSFFGQIIYRKYLNTKNIYNNSKFLFTISGWYYLAIISSILTLIGLIGLIQYSYQEFQLLNNFFSLLILPQEFARDRYGGAQYLPIELKLLSYMIYPTALSIGALVGSKFWNPITRIIPILFSLCYGIIYSSRTVVILTLVSLISAELSTKVINSNSHKIHFRKLITLSTLLIIGLPLIFVLLQWLRQGFSSDFILDEMLQVARSSMTGSFSAFTQWFHQYDAINYKWGINTFAGPFELLGISNRVQGFYLDFIEVGKSNINIYTAFRGLLEDFGFFGTSLFLFILGFISSIVFFRVKAGWIIGVPILALITGWIIFSPIISLFVNNSIIGGYFLFFIFSFNPFQPLKNLKSKFISMTNHA